MGIGKPRHRGADWNCARTHDPVTDGCRGRWQVFQGPCNLRASRRTSDPIVVRRGSSGIVGSRKNLALELGRCIFEDAEVAGIVIPALVCLGIFWLIGVAVYDFVLDPHITTAAALDSLSIDPDKCFPR